MKRRYPQIQSTRVVHKLTKTPHVDVIGVNDVNLRYEDSRLKHATTLCWGVKRERHYYKVLRLRTNIKILKRDSSDKCNQSDLEQEPPSAWWLPRIVFWM